MIRTEELRKSYGGVHACDAMTLDIMPGSVTAVVGPNGAGKSTLVQLLSGVTRPDSGRIFLRDKDITRTSSAHRFGLGISRTFQTARVFPGLSVMDSVLVGAYNGLLYEEHGFGLATTVRDVSTSLIRSPGWRRRHAEARSRAEEAIELFGDRLKPRLENLTFTLSYANRRRTEIARAIASHPSLLLLDEPTAGMNPTETEELAALLSELKTNRPAMTVLFVEHKMNVVRQMSERVIVMDAGKVIADGDPSAALDDPKVIAAYLGTGGADVAQAR